MNFRIFVLLGGVCLVMSSCFSQEETPRSAPGRSHVRSEEIVPEKKLEPSKDKSLDAYVRYFEQADAIHREAWWVLSEERRPTGKSPFGKVQRALLSSQNIKLTNKSLFRCDRYLVKRDVLDLLGASQKFEIFEKCSEKTQAKRLAEVTTAGAHQLQVVFYPENLEEVLGLGASVMNKSIQCTLKGNDKGQLMTLNCRDWAQDRTKEQMIRLDTYDFERGGKNLIKLRGKVYENLTDTRKIVADVPLEGKVEVLETELYPPVEEAPRPTPTPTPLKKDQKLLPPSPREHVVDPDVLMQQQQQQQEQQGQEQQPNPVMAVPVAPGGTLGTGVTPEQPEQTEPPEQAEQPEQPQER